MALLITAVLGLTMTGGIAEAEPGHDTGFLNDPATSEIGTRVNSAGDEVYTDPMGREVVLRGWAVSGTTKLAENGALPFRSTADAASSFAAMAAGTGAGVVRFQLSWEGVQPHPGQIDREYLRRAAAQIQQATQRGIRVIVEYHSDIMARDLFRPDSRYTGNGMPGWVVDALGLTGRESCLICINWGQHMLNDETGVRPAARAFWENAPIEVGGRRVGVHDLFVEQARAALPVLREYLGDADWTRVVGYEPVNEPFDGGMGDRSVAEWENELLWPFYNKIRAAMDATGWRHKLLFAEPNVFWDSRLPVAPALGVHANPKPSDRIVFTPHFYDNGRQIPGAPTPGNGDYFELFGPIREVPHRIETPVLVSEFGIQIGGSGAKDTDRQLQGMYQAIESDADESTEDTGDLAEYARVLSSTEWHWDVYRGDHHEQVNGNPLRVETEGDGWNGEDYSVIERNAVGAIEYTVDPNNVQRIHLQAAQGEILNFAHNARATDADGTTLEWLQLSPGDGADYFRGSRFAHLTWKGRHSDAPGQLFLPPTVDPRDTAVITDSGVRSGLPVGTQPAGTPGEVLYVPGTGGSGRLLHWNDPKPGDTRETRHFMLVVPGAAATLTEAGATTPEQRHDLLERIRTHLLRTVAVEHRNPVRLTEVDR